MTGNLTSLFNDTSAFYALCDPDDDCHDNACIFFESVKQDVRVQLFTSNYIIDKSLALIRMKLGHPVALRFGKQVRESRILNIVRIDEELEEAAWQIFNNYGDKDYSFSDCTSFALMKSRNISDAFAFDKHFIQDGFIMHP